ncbi:carbohydrate ABC transporter permease [Marisediminicola senii]|uniref:carbohydrate ABC transporter permease n=1 Tax=Marisediminicola senii TaxID=2711233 RepID=UPI0013EA40A4|nr:carbohydrate ABC transporter permease [Marisediminicola senii]
MSATTPAVSLPVDDQTKRRLDRGGKSEASTMAGRTKKRLSSRGATLGALVIAVLWTLPTLGLFISSFRPAGLVNTTGWWTIVQNPGFTFDNYVEVLGTGNSQLDLAGAFINSLAITIPATVFPLVIATLAAYAFAWIPFKGKNWLFIGVFALQIVPIQMALIPLLSLFSRGLNIGGVQIFDSLGSAGGYGQVWIAHTIFALPLAIFLLHAFVSEIPGEVIEAARVDGASHGQLFFRIVLPLSMPAIASFAIFQFIWVWNDLLVGLVFADGAAAPMTKLLAEIVGQRGQDWYLLTAGAFISILVPLVVFFSLQRYFVRGLLAGSTKG